MSESPSICYRFGLETSNRGPGCENVGETRVITLRAGAKKVHVSEAKVLVTSRGLATPDEDQIFGPGGTLGGRSSSSSSTATSSGGAVNPNTGYVDNDPALDSFSPNSTIRPIEQSDFENAPSLDVVKGDGLSTAYSDTSSPSGPSKPPTPPSTRPYIWKYQ